MSIFGALPAEAGEANENVYRELDAIWTLRPEIGAALADAQAAVRGSSGLGARLLELVRLRIAFHNQCRTCMAMRYEPDSVSEDLVCSLERPVDAADLDDAERAALRFADKFATDHFAIDAGEYDRLRAHYDDGEIVGLGAFCALMLGLGRLTATWQVVDHLPAAFRGDTGRVAPWGQAEVLRGIRRGSGADR